MPKLKQTDNLFSCSGKVIHAALRAIGKLRVTSYGIRKTQRLKKPLTFLALTRIVMIVSQVIRLAWQVPTNHELVSQEKLLPVP